MSRPTVAIIGAGIGGSTLARCLSRQGISVVIYDKAKASPRYNYAITLEAPSYRPLLQTLAIDEGAFRSRVVVDSPIGRPTSSRDQAQPAHIVSTLDKDDIHAHREKFERFVRGDVEIKWERLVERVELDRPPRVVFADGTSAQHDHIIAADGVHSAIRKSLVGDDHLTVLPYVAINGKRRIPRALFETHYRPGFGSSHSIHLIKQDVRLAVDVFDQTEDTVSINWTYSRRPRYGRDALYRPDRPQSGATEIPEEFYDEIAALHSSSPHPSTSSPSSPVSASLPASSLPAPFDNVFSIDELRAERKLSWLMRTSLIPRDRLVDLARRNVTVIGDAAHAQPILGGGGANAAIRDAVQLAAFVAEKGLDRMDGWIEDKWKEWKGGVEESVEEIARMHPRTPLQGENGNL